jgi:2-amino-4-hydroxy-6-hydroxymethyldihydropteridine diphosphokinase
VARAYVGVGSNLGDREATIHRAVAMLEKTRGVEVVRVSTLRETEPMGVVDQPWFLNGAVAVETTLPPHELLGLLLAVERELGRDRAGIRWGPRTIDLDLLVYEGEVIDEQWLQVPHPLLHERRFALEPLAELDPELEIPGRGRVSELLARLH